MKKALSTLLIILITCGVCYLIYRIFCHKPKSEYPYLLYSMNEAAKWPNVDSYDAFIFNPFDSNTTETMSLVAYGQDTPDSSTIPFQVLSRPFSIYADTITGHGHIDTTNIAFGNLQIPGDLFNKMIRDRDSGANCLLYVPYIDTTIFRHLTYQIHLAIYDSSIGKITRLVRFDTANPVHRKYRGTKYDVKYNDPDDPGHINLNPCPPAHMDY